VKREAKDNGIGKETLVKKRTGKRNGRKEK
jgi:hypothetical protein